jgi:hypothetical protein
VEAQIRELQETLAVMRQKVRIYEDHLGRGEADRLWNPSHQDAGAEAGTGAGTGAGAEAGARAVAGAGTDADQECRTS